MKPKGMQRFTRTDVWREGVWLDLWSVVHLLSGTLVGFVLYLLNFSGEASAVIAFLLFVLYEMWEVMVQIEETPTNRMMDVVVGMVGYGISYFGIAPYCSQIQVVGMFVVLACVDAVASTFGWIASRKAAILEQKMRTRYHRERAMLRAEIAKHRHRKHEKS